MQPFHGRSVGRATLVCVPWAGGSATVYQPWQQLTSQLDIVGVQLPGRSSRFAEPALSQVDDIADALLVQLAAVNGDYALFGHSMGALVAYELAHRVHSTGARPPLALYVSGLPAPHITLPPPIYQLPEEELVRWLRHNGVFDDELTQSPELLRMLLPTLRADLAVVDTYRYRKRPPLPWPIRVFGGSDDAECRPTLPDWSAHTSARCTVDEFPGGHFFLLDHLADIVARIESELMSYLEAMR